MPVADHAPYSQSAAGLPVCGNPCRNSIGRAIFHMCPDSLIKRRGNRTHSQHPAHGIPPVKRSLRPSQQVQPAYVHHIEIVAALVQDRYAVNIKAHDRIVHP